LQADARGFEHDAAGLEFILHVQNGGLDLVELEPFAQHVDQVELAAKDAPGGADRERAVSVSTTAGSQLWAIASKEGSVS
jgi:hypothetical protein